MGALSNKILSYNPEQFIRFNTAYSTTPTNLGSGGQGTWSLSNEAPVLNATGGPESEGCWQFNWGGNNDNTVTRFRVLSSTNVINNPEITDASYSTGIWFRFTQPITTSTALGSAYSFFTIATESQYASAGVIPSSTTNPNRGKFTTIYTQSGSAVNSTNRIDDGSWHYVAIRFNKTATGVFDGDLYLDGQLLSTISQKTYTPSTVFLTEIGTLSTTITPDNMGLMEFANFYSSPYSAIDATAIAEIWTAGFTPAGTDITITETPATATALQVLPTISISSNNVETPATASALMTEPTIAITANDHVEITTSILVSAEFPQNIVASGDKNVNITVTEILTASTEIINNVVVSTGTDASFSAAEFIASAELVEARVSEVPMIASATMPGGNAVVQANYYSLVKALNPYMYIYDGKSTSTTNAGYQTGTFTKDLNVQTTKDLGTPLNLIGEGKSWQGPIGSSDGKFQFTTPTTAESFHELVSTGTFAWEAWIKPTFIPSGVSDAILYFVRGPIRVYLDRRYSALSDGTPAQPGKVKFAIQDSVNNTFKTFEIPSASTSLSGNNWAHIVVQSYNDGTAGTRRAEIWINGTRYVTQNYAYSDWTSNTTTSTVFGSDHITSFGTISATFGSGQGIDEIAIYSQPLTNSQIINHYNFISSASPNVDYTASVLDADADSGDHLVLAIQNAIIPEIPVTAAGILVNPSILAVKNISTSAPVLTASAENTDVTVYWGWTIYETPAIAYAERPETYFLNDLYYQYVQSNIAPYRYVTFDAADASFDYGTDNDYSVTPTTIGGTVVNPDLGINGKSVKTAGTSYITDGVILKESEYNDDWGTTTNTYHSAFWFQRALDDASTTGLRVLWNLNGYYDNQHIILYQYQNKLTLSFSDGTSNFINQSTVNNINLFDGQRHFIVIYVDHQGINDTAYLYVDSVLQMSVDLDTYRVETINGITAVGPNDETNNHPRLSVGCLITPFASTSLPVQPANTKLIVDEIYWDKNAINQTMVTNLYNAMPDKNNKNIMAEAFFASDEFVMPAFSTSSIVSAVPLTASVEFVQPAIVAVRNLVTTADVMTVTANAGDAKVFEDRLINADVFVATAIFDNPGVVITIPGGPMTAHAFMRDDAVYLNDWNILVLTQTYKQMADAVSGVGTWMIGDVK